MQRAILILGLTIFVTLAYGQVKPPLAVGELKEGLNPSEEIRLFDLKEIKQRKIDTALIIYHPASWAEYHPTANPCTCSYNDTLSRYVFDREGRITQYTYFHQLGDYSTTIHYDTLGNRTAITDYRRSGAKAGFNTYKLDNTPDTSAFKAVFIRKKIGKDSLINIISFQKFKHGLDTATIETKRYNSKGKLVEIQSSVNKKNEREFDDDTGLSTYHFEYRYDDNGRLIYYRDFSTQEYQKLSYPFYGKLTEVYSVVNNQLKDRHLKVTQEEKGVITITFDRKQITLTPFEKESKLFKLVSVVEPSEFPLLYYHEVVYKSND